MSEGYRKAALALRALSEADRGWVLGQLAAGHRRRLSGMLAEISRLGFDVSPEDLAGLLGDAPARAEAVAPRSTVPETAERAKPAEPAEPTGALTPVAAARERIGRAGVATLLPLLQDEPAAVLTALHELADGPWKAALRQARPDARPLPAAGGQWPATPAPAPAMADALLLALAARLGHDTGHDTGHQGRRTWAT